MRHPIVESAAGRAALTLVTVALLWWGGRFPLRAQAAGSAVDQPPAEKTAASAKPGNGKPGRRPKKATDPNVPAAATPARKPKDIPIPLPIGESAKTIKIPQTSGTGQLLSLLMAAKATRIDSEHVKMQEMNLDLYHPDGKEDFHIIMPASIFNLNTQIITSEDPVTVRTQDFELTGEKMEFNTVDRTGKLIGKVRMLVHNLKQVAGQSDAAPKPE